MKKSIDKLSLLAAFLIPLLYWVYLLCTSRTQVVWDSLDYEVLGKMLKEQGWVEFFKTGPNREPLYPFFISIAMRLADGWNVSYLKVLDILQFFCLFCSQILTFKILQKLKINPFIIAAIILYMGLSPALVNFALSVYSEILILPFILGVILLITNIFSRLKKANTPTIIFWGVILGTLLILLTLIKGIFELICPLFLLSSLLLLPQFLKNKTTRHYILLLIISLLTFYALLFSYKSLNKHYNGIFTLTSRGPWALYGFAARRTEPLTTEQWLTNLAYIPGEGACTTIFNADKCVFWTVSTSDSFGMTKLKDLQNEGLSGDILDKQLVHLSIERIMTKPGQYALLTAMEGLKIFFWESTKMAFVVYPRWLEKIFFECTAFNYTLRILTALFSILGLGAVLVSLLRRKNLNDDQQLILFFTTALIITYTAAYSIFLINTRYAIPLVPLFLISVAWFLQLIIPANKLPSPKHTKHKQASKKRQ